MSHPALKKDNVAVITGASLGGIGYSIATICLQRYGMKVILVDISESLLDTTAKGLLKAGVEEARFITQACDVSKFDQVLQLKEFAYEKFGKVDFLVLNAGVQNPSKDYDSDPKSSLEAWHKILDVNMFGVLHGTQAFVDSIVKQDSPAAVVVTGSKQGITMPPGNPAYNTSKAAVKTITEALAHSLIPTQVTAHLLVPGYTYTKLTTGNKNLEEGAEKPAAAWTADQVAEELFSRIDKEFYIICPDNDVTWGLDKARMEWNFGDILEKRPALSRWNPEYKDAFAKHVEEHTK